MGDPRRLRSEGDIYHVVTRGVSRQILFNEEADFARMLELLDSHLVQRGCEVYAWCLMGNHVHLLVGQKLEDLSGYMMALDVAYAKYFNLKYGRVGHLFQGRFSSEPIDDDERFLTVVRYIHQNPWRAGIANSCEYAWSSYAEYLAKPFVTQTGRALEMLGGVERFRAFHEVRDFGSRCLDIGDDRTPMTDIAAREIAASVLGETELARVVRMPRDERNVALRTLKDAGLSVRRIERITGVGRGIISRA